MALEQRAQTWFPLSTDQNQWPQMTREFTTHSGLLRAPKQHTTQPWFLVFCPARTGELIHSAFYFLNIVPSPNHQVSQTRELREPQSPSYSLTWVGNKVVLSNCSLSVENFPIPLLRAQTVAQSKNRL